MDKNQGDEPLSSEELLKRARDGLGDSATTPPADFEIESYPPPVPEAETPEYTQPEDSPEPPRTWGEEPGPVSDSVSDWAPPRPDTQPTDRSSDSTGWAPPPTDPDRTASGPAPVPVRKQAGSLFSKMWILVVLLFLGVGAYNFFDTSKTVDEITVGDCLNAPEEEEFFEIDPIDCSDPHQLEIFALVDLRSEFPAGTVYPGNVVFDAALEECFNAFQSYVGTPYEKSEIWMDAFVPTFEGWNELDDRTASCFLFELNQSQTEYVMTTGSFRNSGR